MDVEELIEKIRTGSRAPLYLLHGEEPFFIDQISNYIQDHLLNETEQVFNQRIFYGKDSDYKMILDEARQYPMMSTHRLVVLREAQEMRSFLELEAYFENPVGSTILVLCYKYKKLDQRTKAAKFLKQNGVIFESKKLYDNQLSPWILQEAGKKGIKLKPEAAHLLAEYLGADLGGIAQNLDKIKLSVEPEQTVSAQDLEPIIGIHKEFNVFEMQKALGQRDKHKIFQIVDYFDSNPKSNPLVMTLASLFNFFSKLYVAKAGDHRNDKDLLSALQLKSSFFLKEYKEALKHYSLRQLENVLFLLREYDLKSKGINSKGGEDGQMLKELISRVLM
ncbi:MAG: DNA polymerase III subunit delta [Saprospiraceae bacterium]|nr:DNA polymerase III subunit delta [Saprospiraceae bacterium]